MGLDEDDPLPSLDRRGLLRRAAGLGLAIPVGGFVELTFNGYANQYVEHRSRSRSASRSGSSSSTPVPTSGRVSTSSARSSTLANANPANKTVGQQSVTIGPGDGARVELTLTEPDIYPAVNHAFGHAQHGAIALLQAA